MGGRVGGGAEVGGGMLYGLLLAAFFLVNSGRNRHLLERTRIYRNTANLSGIL